MPTVRQVRLTNKHRRELTLIAAIAERATATRARSAVVADIDSWWDRTSSGFERIAVQGFESSVSSAVRYLTDHAAIEGIDLDPVLAIPEREAIATSLRVAGPVAFKTHMRVSGSTEAAKRILVKSTTATMRRLALSGARRTTIETIAAVPSILGYQRVTASGACDFCTMLAGRGAVYKTDTALVVAGGRNGQPRGTQRVGQSFHDSCRCTTEPVYS